VEATSTLNFTLAYPVLVGDDDTGIQFAHGAQLRAKGTCQCNIVNFRTNSPAETLGTLGITYIWFDAEYYGVGDTTILAFVVDPTASLLLQGRMQLSIAMTIGPVPVIANAIINILPTGNPNVDHITFAGASLTIPAGSSFTVSGTATHSFAASSINLFFGASLSLSGGTLQFTSASTLSATVAARATLSMAASHLFPPHPHVLDSRPTPV